MSSSGRSAISTPRADGDHPLQQLNPCAVVPLAGGRHSRYGCCKMALQTHLLPASVGYAWACPVVRGGSHYDALPAVFRRRTYDLGRAVTMRTRWLIFLPLALMVAAPMEGEGTRARDTRRHMVVPQAQQATTPVRVAPSMKQSEGRPTGIIAPGGTPPTNGVTPPTDAPSGDDIAEESPQPLQDAHRDYRGQLLVLPGAEGFGSTTPAGRGGRILRVTTLADSGPGRDRKSVV